MMDAAARNNLDRAREAASACANCLHGHALHQQARTLIMAIEQEISANRAPGSTEVIGGATITHRPDLMYADRIAQEPAGGYPPLRKGPIGGEVHQQKQPTQPAEVATTGLVQR